MMIMMLLLLLLMLIAADEAQMDGHLQLIRVECECKGKCNSHHFHSQLQAFDLLSLPPSLSLCLCLPFVNMKRAWLMRRVQLYSSL